MFALVFHIGPYRLALDAHRVKEVLPRVLLKPLVGSPTWIVGGFDYRGQIVPVIDLHRLLGAGECPLHLSSRIMLVPTGSDHRLLGLLAAQVDDVHHLDVATKMPAAVRNDGGPVGAALSDKDGLLHVLDVDRLLAGAVHGPVSLPALGGPA
jgi:chemotaxis-related protein WspB